MKTLFMETTAIAPERTIAEIEEILVRSMSSMPIVWVYFPPEDIMTNQEFEELVYQRIQKINTILASCVNPLHLWLGTQKDNMRDAAKKGRIVALRGEQSGKAVFTWKKIRAMRKLYATGHSQVSIAKRFHTRQGTIGRILRNEGWREIYA